MAGSGSDKLKDFLRCLGLSTAGLAWIFVIALGSRNMRLKGETHPKSIYIGCDSPQSTIEKRYPITRTWSKGKNTRESESYWLTTCNISFSRSFVYWPPEPRSATSSQAFSSGKYKLLRDNEVDGDKSFSLALHSKLLCNSRFRRKDKLLRLC
jgi:hypothetical protein